MGGRAMSKVPSALVCWVAEGMGWGGVQTDAGWPPQEAVGACGCCCGGCVCVCVCVCVEQGEDVARKGVGVERGLTTPPTAFQQIP